MQRTAQAVAERGGDFPTTVDELLKLPGVGPYTAGAIACFAFEQDVPFIDTNMRRVLHRLFIGVDVPKPTISEKEIIALAEESIPRGDAWNWNQGLIEFGALQCTARKPLCIICPLQSECNAYPDIQTAIAKNGKTTRTRKQVPFEHTSRYFRGRIVHALREHEGDGIAVAELGPVLKPDFSDHDMPWLIELVQGLERDGLAAIAEDKAEYDVSETRIRLP
jgi:A/G-specific adenine glycosylase